MGRIRTVKPEFFRHEGLQELEAANPGAYVMLVFEGLWTVSDAQGVFEYRPRFLKLDVLPFLNYDMAATLAILEEAGLIKRFEADGKPYAVILTFRDHQRLSGKEAQYGAKFPTPIWHGEAPVITPGSDGEAPVKHPGEQEQGKDIRKGYKEQGKERENPLPLSKQQTGGSALSFAEEFDFSIWPEYKGLNPNGAQAARIAYAEVRGSGIEAQPIVDGIRRYAAYLDGGGSGGMAKQLANWLGPRSKGWQEAWQVPVKPKGLSIRDRSLSEFKKSALEAS